MRGLSTGGSLRFKIDLLFLLCFTLYLSTISKYEPPRGLYSEGRFYGRFSVLRVWGAYFRNFTVCDFMRFNDHRRISRFFCEQGLHSLEKSSNFRESP